MAFHEAMPYKLLVRYWFVALQVNSSQELIDILSHAPSGKTGGPYPVK